MPVILDSVSQSDGPSGVIRLHFAVSPGRIATLLGNGSPVMRTLELDEMGSATWAFIDGKRSVADIAQQLAQQYKLLPKEAEMSVSIFMRELGRRGLIALREPQPRQSS